MSRFYGTLKGKAKTQATRCGYNSITTHAASWAGAVRVNVYLDKDGTERFEVLQVPWRGEGITKTLATGVMGTDRGGWVNTEFPSGA